MAFYEKFCHVFFLKLSKMKYHIMGPPLRFLIMLNLSYLVTLAVILVQLTIHMFMYNSFLHFYIFGNFQLNIYVAFISNTVKQHGHLLLSQYCLHFVIFRIHTILKYVWKTSFCMVVLSMIHYAVHKVPIYYIKLCVCNFSFIDQYYPAFLL